MDGGRGDDWSGLVMKLAAIAVAVPFSIVLLVGAASGDGATSATGQVGEFPAGMPAAPQPFRGTTSGCTMPDPTGTGGCVTPATAWMLTELGRAFGPMPTSCWDAHAWNPSSDHPRGKGYDVTFGRLGEFPAEANVDRGWLVARWLQLHAAALRVKYLIWQGLIWHSGRSDDGWITYTGGGVYDPASPTGGHYDHIHISTTS